MKTEEQRIQELEEEVREIRDTQTEMAANIKEIRDALVGTPLNKSGFVTHIEDFKNRIEKMELLIQNGKWLLIGLSVGTGAGITALIQSIIETFLNHK